MPEREIAGLIALITLVLIAPSPVLKTNSTADLSYEITPEGFVFSTYFGGEDEDHVYQVVVDGAGNSYVVGYTYSTYFPTLNAYQSAYGGGYEDAFIAKFSANGSLLFSTYLGGEKSERVYDIALDAAGNCYVTGYTSSEDFPVKNAYQSIKKGGVDAFISKFAVNGTLLFSTFLGGTYTESGGIGTNFGYGIAVDSDGNSYITGKTLCTDFPVMNAYNDTHSGGWDVFVTKLNATGNGLLFSTYAGEYDYDEGWNIGLDGSGNIYVTVFAHQNKDGVMKFTPNGTLLFRIELGGFGMIEIHGIAVDTAGNCHITGTTLAKDFPVQNANQPVHGGGQYDAFVTRLAPNGSLLFSTYLGGLGDDHGRGIALDATGNIHVTGVTGSDDFPVLNTSLTSHVGAEIFIAKFTPNGSLRFSTFFGALGLDYGYGIAIDDVQNVHIVGETNSDDFPTLNARQNTRRGSTDVYIAVFPTTMNWSAFRTSTAKETSTVSNDGPGWTLLLLLPSIFVAVLFKRAKKVPEKR
ncbi:MAG: SBBP repeat-containing protein [Candidatus Thorarchaeota archaeon]